MRKLFLVLLSLAVMTGVALADNGLGIFGTYWDTEDLGGGFGGGIKFRGNLGDLFGVDLRASCVTQLDDWEGDDDLYLIPLEALLLFRIPLGEYSPVKAYVGGGGGYVIVPEADDIDFDDDFCFIGVGGIEFALNENVSLFAEAMYRFFEVDGMEIDGENIDLKGELEFTGFGVNAGLFFRF
ncbi:MAG: outer membrane beta-barrel protein [Kiritimatiellia bacterium]|jgi:hypothetical protein|nr:outer membrane beta-barrel protein [Lentisphaerota bacterium]